MQHRQVDWNRFRKRITSSRSCPCGRTWAACRFTNPATHGANKHTRTSYRRLVRTSCCPCLSSMLTGKNMVLPSFSEVRTQDAHRSDRIETCPSLFRKWGGHVCGCGASSRERVKNCCRTVRHMLRAFEHSKPGARKLDNLVAPLLS